MYLKKLEMIGFKSFAESMVVTFQPGITAIVGPNGCGKSNIVDAVLWVLGEQSTKALRSDRMEDVIFNGSETRRPLNLSEVILTVGDVSGEVAGQFGDYQEIEISRRLFRTGESEYRINKTPCRLRDIRDLLIDTGAGHKGHTIIEQGKVDQLLNASPLERRELIEDYRDLVPGVKIDEWRRIRGEQDVIVRYEPERALETLPKLIADPAERERVVTLFEKLLADKRFQDMDPTDRQKAMLERLRAMLLARVPAGKSPSPVRALRAGG